MPIKPSDFDAYETLILSGQIEHHEAVKLLADEPDFAAWYRARRKASALTNTEWTAQFGNNEGDENA